MQFDWHDIVAAGTHLCWGLLAIPGWYYLVKDSLKKITLSVFMSTVVLCYFSSFMYHAAATPWVPTFQLCDHICIFLLIAGTYTPIVWKYCTRGRVRTLCFVWGLALLGIAFRLATGHPHEFLYMALAWGSILASYDLLKILFRKDCILIVVGGLLYSIGAVLELFQVPNLIPHWLEHHEVFHLFVMAGTTCHYFFMLRELSGRRPKIRNELQSY